MISKFKKWLQRWINQSHSIKKLQEQNDLLEDTIKRQQDAINNLQSIIEDMNLICDMKEHNIRKSELVIDKLKNLLLEIDAKTAE